MKIKDIKIRSILNSKNEETVEVTVNNNFKASSGGDGIFNRNLKELPKKNSLDYINKILNKGFYKYEINSFNDIIDVEEILLSYDKSKDLSLIGGNVLLALEFALLKSASEDRILDFLNVKPRKIPAHICNCIAINYDAKENRQQEISLIPKGDNFRDSVFCNSYIYRKIGNLTRSRERNEVGSFISRSNIEDNLIMLEKLTNEVTKKLSVEFSFGISINAEDYYKNKLYRFGKKGISLNNHLKELNKLTEKFDIDYIEDPLSSKDVKSIKKIKNEYLCGNRIFGSNIDNIKKYAKYFNCALIKINEVGGLGKLKKIVSFCKNNDIKIVLGQNLGETNEKIISHLAVGFGFDFIKYGLTEKERYLKLSELKIIEAEYLK
ncbi:hypothetical protein HYX16_03145 [Candidatus Woesearchaeota archaeon]|nr:hypothetical protein [Candidatus Woesearchaeota archaeon]